MHTYQQSLAALGELLSFNPLNKAQLADMLGEVEDTYDAIKQRWSNPNTRAKILTAVLAAVKASGIDLHPRALSQWKHIHYVLRRNSARRDGKLNERESEAWVPFSEICDMRRRLEVHENGSMRHLFLAWYSLWPPTRADHFDTAIYRTESDVPSELRAWMYFRPPHVDNGTVRMKPPSALPQGGSRTVIVSRRSDTMPRANFIVLEPSTPREWTGVKIARPAYVDEWDRAPRMILLNHKTANTHGRIVRALPPALTEVLAASLRAQPREALFLTPTGMPFSNSHAFTVWGERTLERLFDGRRLGFNGLRHVYISNVDMDKSSPQQLITLARDMGHSALQQKLYVRGNFKEGREPVLKSD